ncbi:MAG: thioredoxin family protein [Flavobacteriaceae bacterium]|nr:thioredoxin family protein [Flavobacteriaceae bacterium]|tara:strand:- start:9610 stop:10191 length:582 start_codon:yes stop_codon:yes gene_type:complete
MLSNFKTCSPKFFFIPFIIIYLFLLSANVYSQQINWISINELEDVLKTNEKNIIIDLYTNWCGPCKLMEKNTFQNKYISKFINENYHAVKFNAEGNETVTFTEKVFQNPNFDVKRVNTRNATHEFTRFLGVSAYPTTIFLDKDMSLITPVRGYLIPKQLEIYLELFKNDQYKKITSQLDFDNFIKSFESNILD